MLLRWTKGFGAPNVEGHDVVAMLEKSLKKFVRRSLLPHPARLPNCVFSRRQEVPVQITALVNDTTGTLIASAYVDRGTRAGIIFGTGCNAACA